MHLTKHFDYARLHSDQALPVVLLVPVVGDAAVVHHVEDSDKPGSDLEEGGEAAVLGQRVLVVPAPVGPDQVQACIYRTWLC